MKLFGVLGISRKSNLMYKELKYEKLSLIIEEFVESYRKWNHSVLRIRIGLAFEHDISSFRIPCWHCYVKYVNGNEGDLVFECADRFFLNFRTLIKEYHLNGKRPDYK